METRALGSQGLSVSRLGFGCFGMSDGYGEADDAESVATLERALDLGVALFDTSDAYGPFENERLLGRALRERRDGVVVATKFGIARDEDGNRLGIRGDPEYVRSACEASLRRLEVDEIDLYYQHRVDKQVPIEETVGAMAELVEQGKVRYLGLSEASVETVRRAHAVHPISALQTEYSLWTRDVEREILPAMRELGIGFVAYSPLGRGFLTGSIASTDDLEEGDARRNNPRFLPENLDANLAIVERVRAIAREKGVTPAQMALAWVLAQGEDIVPIPGTRRRDRLEENVRAAAVELDAEDLRLLDAAVPLDAATGERYEDMSSIDA